MAFPETGILDNFNRGNEGPPLSADWTSVTNGLKVEAQVAKGNGGSQGHWELYETVYGPNCECYVTGVDHLTTSVYARMTTFVEGTTDGYRAEIFSDDVLIYRVDDGASTQLGVAIVQTDDDGDKIGIECVGSTITAYFWDASGAAAWVEMGDRSDGAHSNAGYIGIRVYGNKTMDDFGGGTIAAGGISIPIGLLHRKIMKNLLTR